MDRPEPLIFYCTCVPAPFVAPNPSYVATSACGYRRTLSWTELCKK